MSPVGDFEPEDADDLRQAAGLFLQRAGRGGGFFHQRRVLLRDLVHLRDGLVDLFDALRSAPGWPT